MPAHCCTLNAVFASHTNILRPTTWRRVVYLVTIDREFSYAAIRTVH